jgi:hypothetical protein
MTDAITVRQPQTAIATRVDVLEGVTFADLVSMGQELARTGFLPDHIKTGPQFAAIVMTGRELGMTPMRAVRSLQMVKGKVVEDAASQLARFKAAGGRATFLHLDETKAVLELTHPNGDKHTETWTLEDAKRAGLSGGMVGKFPKAMLRSRAITAGLKSLGWDGAVGAYDPSELVADADEQPQQTPQRVRESDAVEQPKAPPMPPEVKRICDLAILLIEAPDVDTVSYGVSNIEETILDVFDTAKRDRYRLALDGLAERRACELNGTPDDWHPSPAKREAAVRLDGIARKHRADT